LITGSGSIASSAGLSTPVSASGTAGFRNWDSSNQDYLTVRVGAGSADRVFVAGTVTDISGLSFGDTGDAGNVSNFGLIVASSTSGDRFSLEYDATLAQPFRLNLPTGYTFGQSLNGTATLQNTTLAALGLNVGDVGTFAYSTGSGTETFRLEAVPEPGSLAVVSGLVAGLSVLSRRRRQA
jgi:hypothetical protein